MRALSKAILGLIFACIVNYRSAPSHDLASVDSQKERPLQLIMKIVGEGYCIGDSELDGLWLKVRLVYTNNGKEPIILYKGSTAISRLMISHNLMEAAAKRFEINSSLTQITSGGENCYMGSVPTSCFVSLPPRACYEVETTVQVFVVRGDAREITGAVKSGDHVLQVEVPTWHESNQLANELISRWRRNGRLWHEPVMSEPIRFTVAKDHKVIDCP
jgi:hypothetical protein